jgi:hypothetical protein
MVSAPRPPRPSKSPFPVLREREDRQSPRSQTRDLGHPDLHRLHFKFTRWLY